MTNNEQVKYYRDTAASLRAIAAAVLDPDTKSELSAIATRFEKLANWAEKQYQDCRD